MSAKPEDTIEVDCEEDHSGVAGTGRQGKVDTCDVAEKTMLQLSKLPWGSWLFEQMSVVSRLNQLTKRRMLVFFFLK